MNMPATSREMVVAITRVVRLRNIIPGNLSCCGMEYMRIIFHEDQRMRESLHQDLRLCLLQQTVHCFLTEEQDRFLRAAAVIQTAVKHPLLTQSRRKRRTQRA